MAVERNIKFTVGVGSSPQALTELKKFGEQVRAEQKKIWESSAAGMVKAYKDGLKAMHGGGGFVVEIKKEAAERKKAATSTTLDIQKIHARAEQDDYKFRRSLAVQHHREELKRIQDLKNSRIKAAREESQELAREAARAAKAGRGYVAQMREQQRNAALASSHRFGAMKGASDIGRGALEIGRGVAYSGLVGEDNTQTVIDTIARTESILSIYGGGTSAIKGAHYLAKRLKWLAGFAGMGGAAAAAGGGSAAFGGGAAAAAGGGALALGGGIAAAATGVGLGAWSGYETARDIGRYGFRGGATPGGWNDFIGTNTARFGYGVASISPDSWNEGNAPGEAVMSARAAARMKKEHAKEMGVRGEIAEQFSTYSKMKLEAAGERGGDIRGTLRDAATRLQNLPQGAGAGVRGEAEKYALEARKQMVGLLEEERRKTIEIARERVSGAREALGLARQQADEMKQAAADAKRELGGDLAKFGMADPEEQMQLHEIKRKQAAGEELDEDEIRTAQGYNQFGELAQSEAEKRAKAAGADDVFGDAQSRSDRLAARAAAAAQSVSRAEVTLTDKHEVFVKLESNETLTDALLEKFKDVFKAMDDRLKYQEEKIANGMDLKLRAFAVGHVRK